MNSFRFKEGNPELLDSCSTLWNLFIENAGSAIGIGLNAVERSAIPFENVEAS